MADTMPKQCQVCSKKLRARNKYQYCKEHFQISPEGAIAYRANRFPGVSDEFISDYRNLRTKKFSHEECRQLLNLS
jgi:hypothetical protein